MSYAVGDEVRVSPGSTWKVDSAYSVLRGEAEGESGFDVRLVSFAPMTDRSAKVRKTVGRLSRPLGNMMLGWLHNGGGGATVRRCAGWGRLVVSHTFHDGP